jgi:hypothetical protein
MQCKLVRLLLLLLLQVLPPDMMLLAEPSPEDLLVVLEEALARVHTLDPVAQHVRVRNWYNSSDMLDSLHVRQAAGGGMTSRGHHLEVE